MLLPGARDHPTNCVNLLQGRYKAILVEADAYAAELSRDIHLNPVRAGMVKIGYNP